MGLTEEIFEEFFKKLEDDEEFPNSIVNELRDLLNGKGDISQEDIFEIIKRGEENGDKN